jgi:homoserine kinase
MKKTVNHCIVEVPATTANLGPGFDSLGVALTLTNQITVSRTLKKVTPLPMVQECAEAFFSAAKVKSKQTGYTVEIEGEVPSSRGLGSSVTVRLGVATGLNVLHGLPLSEAQVLKLVVELERHPDNAVPAFYGGFAACSGDKFVRVEVGDALRFIAFIPDFELATKKARAVLPKQVPLAHAVGNLQNTALITAAFIQRHYAMLEGLFVDHLHQPYRAKLIPGWDEIEAAAKKEGCLGFYLSGAGSTLMALADAHPKRVAKAMAEAAAQKGITGVVRVLRANNSGLTWRAD